MAQQIQGAVAAYQVPGYVSANPAGGGPSAVQKPTAGAPIRTSAKQNIVGAPCTLLGLSMCNTSGATIWVQLFDSLAAAVTLGTTLPDLEYQVAANSQIAAPLPACGVPFGAALSYAATTAEGGATPASAAALLLFPLWV